jgi:hypothetical protein
MNSFIETYNTATAKQYEIEIRKIIREYYKNVSKVAIDDFIRTGDFAQLTAEQLLAQSGFFFREIQPQIENVATNFVIKLEMKSNANFRKAYQEQKKAIPNQLKQVEINQTTQNLISQQVNKIKDLTNYQYQKINEVTQQAVVQKMTMSEYKELLRESKLYNEKRIHTIANNQLRFATTVINNEKAKDLDITHATWRHPKNFAIYKTHPRHDHVEADGTVYKISKGCMISGEYIQPGQLPNCLCYAQYVLV